MWILSMWPVLMAIWRLPAISFQTVSVMLQVNYCSTNSLIIFYDLFPCYLLAASVWLYQTRFATVTLCQWSHSTYGIFKFVGIYRCIFLNMFF